MSEFVSVTYSTQNGFPSVRVASRDRWYEVASPVVARGVVALCRVFHRRHRLIGLPSAGRVLTFPVSCRKCGSAFDVVAPHHGRAAARMMSAHFAGGRP